MQVSLDISLYPFDKDYETPILDFILRLRSYPGLEVETHSMSTTLRGEYEEVMAILTQEVKHCFQKDFKSIFVIKCFRLL
jgi:uncharacterized protein YqgV (UPF0045/DUF77 family)